MNPIFNQEITPGTRLVVVLILSVALLVADHKGGYFDPVRGYVQALATPVQYLAHLPSDTLDWMSDNLVTRTQLIKENAELEKQQALFNEQLRQIDVLTRENNRLRALLASPLRTEAKRMVAEILKVENAPFTHQVMINRGATDGVYEGQPVLDNDGIIGQVLHVGTTSSRVLLLTDLSHGIALRNLRNGVRLTASGTGRFDAISLTYVPHSTDIKEGDTLVASGLGGKFPEGYPVATVTSVSFNEAMPFAQVEAQPVSKLDRTQYLLLIWPTQQKPDLVEEGEK